MNSKAAEDKIARAFDLLQVPYVREYRFDEKRKFRFDFAIPEYKVAVEFEGGIFAKSKAELGGHVRGAHYNEDCIKYNLAVFKGWKVLRYTIKTLEKRNGAFIIATEVKNFLSHLMIHGECKL